MSKLVPGPEPSFDSTDYKSDVRVAACQAAAGLGDTAVDAERDGRDAYEAVDALLVGVLGNDDKVAEASGKALGILGVHARSSIRGFASTQQQDPKPEGQAEADKPLAVEALAGGVVGFNLLDFGGRSKLQGAETLPKRIVGNASATLPPSQSRKEHCLAALGAIAKAAAG